MDIFIFMLIFWLFPIMLITQGRNKFMLTPIDANFLSILPFFQIAAVLFLLSTMTTQHMSMRHTHTYFKCMRCNMSNWMGDPTMLVKQMMLLLLDLVIVGIGCSNQQVSGQSSCISEGDSWCSLHIFIYGTHCSPYKYFVQLENEC